MAKVEIPIENPDFLSPYTPRPDPDHGGLPVGEVTVSEGWEPYYTPQTANDPPWRHRRPEWTQYQHWQKVFGTSGTIQGGVLQRVPVEVGDLLTLVVRACFTSNGAGVALRVGIDPFGGVDFRDALWGEWQGETAPQNSPSYWTGGLDNARALSVENIEAQAPYATLFLHIENLYAGKDESAFWDQVMLLKEGEIVPPDPPGGDVLERMVAALERIADAVEKL